MKEVLNCLIVDDVEANHQFMELLLNQYCSESIGKVLNANTVQEAVYVLKRNDINILFLDIELHEENGFELLDKLDNTNLHVVFVTAYDQYAIKAFKYGVVDYLLKPIDIQELKQCVKRIEQRNVTADIHSISQALKTLRAKPKTISLISQNAIDIVPLKDLIRCQADGRYTECILADGRKIVSSKNLKEYESLLPDDQFIRIHYGDIVNISHIKQVLKRKNGIVCLSNGDQIEISQRRKKAFHEAIKQYS